MIVFLVTKTFLNLYSIAIEQPFTSISRRSPGASAEASRMRSAETL